MGKIKNALRIIKRAVFNETGSVNTDPFKQLEERGLIIAESSKKRMYSPWGIDNMLPWLIEIGEECSVSTNVIILAHDASTGFTNGYTKIGRVTIGNHVFIGQGTTVLCGVTIGDNVIIGANSLVNKDIPANSVFAGNPAKYICSFEEYAAKRREELQQVPILEHDWVYWSQKASCEEKNDARERLAVTRIGYFKSHLEPIIKKPEE